MNDSKFQKLKDLIEDIREFPKVAATVVVLAITLIAGSYFLAVYRVPGFIASFKPRIDYPDKDINYHWTTGSCVANTGTESNPDWVSCDRLIGVKSGNDADDAIDDAGQ